SGVTTICGRLRRGWRWTAHRKGMGGFFFRSAIVPHQLEIHLAGPDVRPDAADHHPVTDPVADAGAYKGHNPVEGVLPRRKRLYLHMPFDPVCQFGVEAVGGDARDDRRETFAQMPLHKLRLVAVLAVPFSRGGL